MKSDEIKSVLYRYAAEQAKAQAERDALLAPVEVILVLEDGTWDTKRIDIPAHIAHSLSQDLFETWLQDHPHGVAFWESFEVPIIGIFVVYWTKDLDALGIL